MTTAVIAKTYADAMAASLALGLGNNWVYPHSLEVVRGVQFDRIVYVEGWTASGVIGTEIMQAVNGRRATADLAVTYWPPVPGYRSPAATPAPLVDFDVQNTMAADSRRLRRSWRLPTWMRIPLGGFLGGLFGVVIHRVGLAVGWW